MQRTFKCFLALVLLALTCFFVTVPASAQDQSVPPCQAKGAETLQSDMAHYASGATAQLSGTGYAPSCQLTVRVTGPDSASSSTVVTTDPIGNLAYTYAIGSTQGVFKVDVMLEDPDPWTSTTFTVGPFLETDSPDYAPGNRVTLTGGNWAAGDLVSILIQEIDGPDSDLTLFATADSEGNIINDQFISGSALR